MNPSMDDRRVLAEIERRLARDDPELVTLMDALNHQFPDGDEHTDSRSHDGEQHDWRWKAIVAFALVLVVGLILTAVFSRSSSTDGNHGPPNSRAPVVSVHVQGRGTRPRPWRSRN
jgi:anti-sigma-K factor RskA